MDLITVIEKKLKSIEAKLNSGSSLQLISQNYNNDIDTINAIIFSSSKQAQYENGLNEHREQMLKQLNKDRDAQLKKLNSQQLNFKSSCVSFARSLISIYESILYRTKFRNQFNFGKLVKYTIFMANEKCFRFTNEIYYKHFINILPSNQLFLLFNTHHENKQIEFFMAIVNSKTGDIAHRKSIDNPVDNSIRHYDFKANATNIISFDRFISLIGVYNFKLELVHSFKLEKTYSRLKLNNYDIGLFDCVDSLITCFNYKTTKLDVTNNTYLDKRLYNRRLVVEYLDLLGLNDDFLFIVGYVEQEQCGVFIINRGDFSLFRCIRADSEWFIYDREICYFKGFFESDKIYAYGINPFTESSENDYCLILNHDYEEYKFDDIYLTSNYKYIYSKYMAKNKTHELFRLRVY